MHIRNEEDTKPAHVVSVFCRGLKRRFSYFITRGHRRIRHRDITLQHEHVSSPKFSLPMEVLQMIIRMAHPVEVSFFTLERYPNKDRLETLLALSLVSRFWRQAIVNDPTTWSVINIPSSQSQLQEQVSRSGKVPLHIFVHFELLKHDKDVMRYAIVFNEFNRVKTFILPHSFDIFGDYKDLYPGLLSLIPLYAPMLEILNLGTRSLDGIEFLPGGAPQLKALSIKGPAILSLPLPSFRCLITLSASIWSLPSLKTLTDILLAAPLLEFLSLTCFGDDPYHEGSQLIQLRNLKTLLLRGDQILFSQLLPLLVTPSDISWHFNVRGCTAPIQSLASIIFTIVPNYAHISISPNYGGITLCQSYCKDYSGLLGWPDFSRSINEAVTFTLSLFDLSKVTDLGLSVSFDATPDKLAIRDIYRTLVNLRTLSLYYRGYRREQGVGYFETTYLDCLMDHVETNEHELRTVPCPFLKNLTIMGPRVSCPRYATSLKVLIESRRNAGYPLRGVKLGDLIGGGTMIDISALLDDLVEWELSKWISLLNSF